MPDSASSPNHMQEATLEAVRRARERLSASDLSLAASRGGLTLNADGSVQVFLLGRALRVLPNPITIHAQDGGPVAPGDELLLLRYLEAEREIRPTGEPITFRNLPGGAFYFGPVENRTSKLLLKVFGNDLPRLKAALARYPYDDVQTGDFGARVQAIGRIDVTLVYRLGDEEFPPTLDILYDRAIAAVYHTDEVAALVTRLCVGLIKKP
jgi:hypothetical protein